MRRPLWIVAAVAAVSALTLQAQFGGALDRARRKVEDARRKAKPATDRIEKAATTYAPWTLEQEQQMGEATAAKMVAMFGLVESPALNKYVNLVGAAVARNASRELPYRFGVLDTDIVGAYSLPGGYVFVTKSALEAMENEAQLAGVLGHEIVHAAERHLEASVRGKKTSAWAVEEAKQQAKANETPEFLKKRAEALVQDLFNTKLSRDKEDGADERGVQLAAASGYHPAGLLEFLEALDKIHTNPEGQRATNQLLSTHPPFAERVEHLRPIVAQAGNQGQTNAPRFLAALK